MKHFLTHREGVVANNLKKNIVLGNFTVFALEKLFGKPYTNVFGKDVWDIVTTNGDLYRFVLDRNTLYLYYNTLAESDLIYWGLKSSKPTDIPIATVIVKSFTNKLKQYTVGLHECGKFRCTCPDYIHNNYHECKHILRVKTKLIELNAIR